MSAIIPEMGNAVQEDPQKNDPIKEPEVSKERCYKCGKNAVSFCNHCGLLCLNHDKLHRHETGHITEEIHGDGR